MATIEHTPQPPNESAVKEDRRQAMYWALEFRKIMGEHWSNPDTAGEIVDVAETFYEFLSGQKAE